MPKATTPEEREARFQRLPAWARDEITRLRRDADYHRRDAAALRLGAYGPEDTDTVADPYNDAPLRLPNGASIEFRIGPAHHEVIRVRVRDGVLDVNANGGLLVLPKASNHVDLKVSGH